MSSNTPQKSDIEILAEALDGTLRQKAEAIDAHMDRKLNKFETKLIGQVKDLVGRQGKNIDKAKESEDAEVKASANEATKAVKAADAAVKTAEADPTPDKAKEAKDKVEEAEKKVSKTESDLAARMSAAEERLDNHEGRLKSLEEKQTATTAALDGMLVQVRANARAIALGGDGGRMVRASRVALTVFMVVLVTYWLVWWLTPLDYQWQIDLGLALGAGGLAGWIALIWGADRAEGRAEARANAAADAGLDIVRARADAEARVG